ncbi:MAG: ABC transporter ATP-binding protein [Phycisphaerae bacterium]|nr:ABC transporter ATP-binding protein [Phycisphaerae bacterium]
MIEIRQLTKTYGSLVAVRSLDLQIQEGDIFGFIGPNGAGKTTTMRILSTLLEPTNGSAFINGMNVRRHGRNVRRLVGYMPDFMGVYDDLKVFEYLEFFAAAFSVERKKRKSVIDGVLELTDLHNKKAATVDSLSRGMQQRLGLARVLVHDPKVLILDEPASGLDPRARIEIRELLCELKTMGKTIMISSHILSELEEMCDHVGIIEQGQLVFSGTQAEIHKQLSLHNRYRAQVGQGQAARAVEILSSLPFIQEVAAEGDDDEITITIDDSQADQGRVARAIIEGGMDLLMLQPTKIKLDDAFMQLTQGIVQ